MRITVNKNGQVVDIADSTLVANSTYGNASFIVAFDESLTPSEISKFATCTYSVIRADGVQIDNMYMSLKDKQFEAELKPDFGILDVNGSIQISFQIKTKGDGKVFATIAVAAFVQNNIGKYTQTEANEVEEHLRATWLEPMAADIGKKVDKFEDEHSEDRAYVKSGTIYKDEINYAVISRDGAKRGRGILGATSNGDYEIPEAEKPTNPVQLKQLDERIAECVKTADKGVAGGVVPLDKDTLIEHKYIPEDIKNAADNIDNKVDKLARGTNFTRLYCMPHSGSQNQELYRNIDFSGGKNAYSVLGSDGQGNYQVPEPAYDSSPARKADVEKCVKKADKGQANGVAPLGEDGKLDESYLSSTTKGKLTLAENAVPKNTKGVAGGVASLDSSGKVPASQLPGFVDDVQIVYVRPGATLYSRDWLSLTRNGEALTPEEGKIYIVNEGEFADHQYRWASDMRYGEIKSNLALGEKTGTAYDGAKGKATADKVAEIESDLQNKSEEITALQTASNELKETTALHATGINKNTQDITKLKKDVAEGDVHVGDSEPDNANSDLWIDTSETSIGKDIILKEGENVSLIETTDENGNKVIKISVSSGLKNHRIHVAFYQKSSETSYIKHDFWLSATSPSLSVTGKTWKELCDMLSLPDDDSVVIPVYGSIGGFNRLKYYTTPYYANSSSNGVTLDFKDAPIITDIISEV